MADSPSLLRRFRSDRQRLPLHPLEKAALAVLCVHLCFLPWAIGAMAIWSQMWALGFAVLGLGVALIPRHYDEAHGGGREFRLNPWPRLLRFPLFWIGLLLLGYIALQGYNPSWMWVRNEKSWWLQRVNDIAWLPTSIDTPFERFNLWRQFIIYAAVWLAVCTAWVGLTRRRSLEILLVVVLINAVVFAATGGLERAVGSRFVLSFLQVRPDATSFAGFIYHNHAAAFLALVTGVGAAYAAHYSFSQGALLRRSSPGPVFALAAVLLAVATVLTRSRGAALTLAGFGCVFSLLVLIPSLVRRPADAGNRGVMLSVAVLFAVVLGFAISWLNFDAVIKKFERGIEQRGTEASIGSRLVAYEAAREYWSEYGVRGIGAGGFRFMFPKYVKKRPEIYYNGKLMWEHAHNDWLQIPIELGIAGVSILVLGAGYLARGLVRFRVWRSPLAFTLILGCSQTLVHAWFDFPFQNPAILTTWLVLVVIALRWAEMEASARSADASNK